MKHGFPVEADFTRQRAQFLQAAEAAGATVTRPVVSCLARLYAPTRH